MKRRRRWRGWLLFLALCFCLLCEAVETNTTTVTSTTAAAATTNTTVATTGTTTTSPNVTSTTSSATSNSISTAPATSTVSEAKNTRNNTTTVGTNATSPSPSVSILTTVTPAATSTTSNNGDVTSDYTPTFDLENITTTRAPTRPPAQDLCSHNLSIILYEEESQSSVDIAVDEEEPELEDDDEYDELWFPLYFEAECNLNYTLQYVNHSCDYSVRQSSVSFPPWRDIDSVTFVPRNLSNCSAHGLAVIVAGNQTWYVNPFSLAHLLDAIYNVLGIEDLSANFRRQLAPYRHTLIVPQT